MGTIGGGEKRGIGALCDLQPNFCDIQRDNMPPPPNCYLLGSLVRSDPEEVWRAVTALAPSWVPDVAGYAGIVGGCVALGISEKRRTAIYHIFNHVLGSPLEELC